MCFIDGQNFEVSSPLKTGISFSCSLYTFLFTPMSLVSLRVSSTLKFPMVLFTPIELPHEWTFIGDANEMIPFLPFGSVDGVENKGPTTCLPS